MVFYQSMVFHYLCLLYFILFYLLCSLGKREIPKGKNDFISSRKNIAGT